MSAKVTGCERSIKGEDGKEYFIFSSGYSPLSNFHRTPFVINTVEYLNVEQYIAVQKAYMFLDFETAKQLLSEPSPKKCHDAVIEIKDQGKWIQVRDQILMNALRAKFTQSTLARKKLISTGKSTIVFATAYNSVLGSGFNIEDQRNTASSQLVGVNHLGQMLMKVREDLM